MRKIPGPEQELALGDLRFTPGNPRVAIGEKVIFLTVQELNLLTLLAAKAGDIVSTKALAKQLSRNSRPLTHAGVAVHVHRLRARLAPATGFEIRNLRGFGYLLQTDTEAPRHR